MNVKINLYDKAKLIKTNDICYEDNNKDMLLQKY